MFVMNEIIERSLCTGCSACMNICPASAIEMVEDEDGFLYPSVDVDECTSCFLCREVCPSIKEGCLGCSAVSPDTYVAVHKNKDVLSRSSSGGAFVAIAAYVLNSGGVVCGCAWTKRFEAEHVFVEDDEDLEKLQGSKYVQSRIGLSYRKAQEYLNEGRMLFFTGTPCQVSGLKFFLRKDYENLITADLVCHGVPSQAFLKGYIEYLERKESANLIAFQFRDKTCGWRLVGEAVFTKNGRVYMKRITPVSSYYYNYFVNGHIYRESCYSCRYARAARCGDFTLGDYWGVEKYHSDIDARYGVSLLLVNTNKGRSLLKALSRDLDLTRSDFKKAAANNAQLIKPVAKSSKRDGIFEAWRVGGAYLVASHYRVSLDERVQSAIKGILPYSVKKRLKAILSK